VYGWDNVKYVAYIQRNIWYDNTRVDDNESHVECICEEEELQGNFFNRNSGVLFQTPKWRSLGM